MKPPAYTAYKPTMVRNLLRVYRTAHADDVRDGLAWYPRAFAGVQAVARQHDVPDATVACVIAAISPQCNWTDNVRIAVEMIADRPTSHGGGALQANIRKARAILADRASDVSGYFKSAPKVTAFSHNLRGNGAEITVDTHAAQAALADPTIQARLDARTYAVFADAYRIAADHAGVRPCDFQAVVWCAWKRRYSPERKRAIIRANKGKK